MDISLVGQTIGLFAITNIDDIVILALFFALAKGRRDVWRIVAGQYLGFLAIVVASVVGALAAGLLPRWLVAYLGLIVVVVGLADAWRVWRKHGGRAADGDLDPATRARPPAGVLMVATVTFANSGDNIGVYVPVFAAVRTGELLAFVAAFLVLVAVWCALGYLLARRPLVARSLTRWSHYVLPVVLVGLGIGLLIEGGAFGF